MGSIGDSYDNALAETINGLYKAEIIHRRGPWRSFEAVEFATLEWVDWFNNRRSAGAPPAARQPWVRDGKSLADEIRAALPLVLDLIQGRCNDGSITQAKAAQAVQDKISRRPPMNPHSHQAQPQRPSV